MLSDVLDRVASRQLQLQLQQRRGREWIACPRERFAASESRGSLPLESAKGDVCS